MIDIIQMLAEALPEPVPPEQLLELAKVVQTELESRSGERIYDSMPEASAFAFEEATDAGDEALARHILEVECPQYKDIVAATLQELIAEVAQRFSGPARQ